MTVIGEPTEVMKPSSHAKGMERRQPHSAKKWFGNKSNLAAKLSPGARPPMSNAVQPFRIAATDSQLDDLKRRLRETRCPERDCVDDR